MTPKEHMKNMKPFGTRLTPPQLDPKFRGFRPEYFLNEKIKIIVLLRQTTFINKLVVLNIIIMRYFMYGSVISSASENHPWQYNFHHLSYFLNLDNKDDVKDYKFIYRSCLSEQHLQFEPNFKCIQ